ncbi:hypothetical protein BX666DRAFT_2024386 [Dichotomocladium elegans]|nr:hypothetical protein BX666DRAFT_2024386 [Dichotomocladium elegans]
MSLTKVLSDIQALYSPAHGPVRNQLWYVLAAVVMTSLNRPKDVPRIYEAVEKSIQEGKKDDMTTEKSKVLMRMREGIFKSFVIIGYPKVINSLQALNTAVPSEVLAEIPTTPIRKETSWEDVNLQRERGYKLFDAVYDRHSKRVQENMHVAYPDLAQAAIHHLYGPVLAEPSIISAQETSLCIVAGLMVQDVPAQLRGHRYGALNQGATQQDLSRLESLVEIVTKYSESNKSNVTCES